MKGIKFALNWVIAIPPRPSLGGAWGGKIWFFAYHWWWLNKTYIDKAIEFRNIAATMILICPKVGEGDKIIYFTHLTHHTSWLYFDGVQFLENLIFPSSFNIFLTYQIKQFMHQIVWNFKLFNFNYHHFYLKFLHLTKKKKNCVSKVSIWCKILSSSLLVTQICYVLVMRH